MDYELADPCVLARLSLQRLRVPLARSKTENSQDFSLSGIEPPNRTLAATQSAAYDSVQCHANATSRNASQNRIANLQGGNRSLANKQSPRILGSAEPPRSQHRYLTRPARFDAGWCGFREGWVLDRCGRVARARVAPGGEKRSIRDLSGLWQNLRGKEPPMQDKEFYQHVLVPDLSMDGP